MALIEEFEISIPSDTAEAQRVQDRIIQVLENNEFPMRAIFGMRLSLEEALVNAIKHGNQRDPNKSVRVYCRICNEKVRIEIEDEGEGFDPDEVPDPTKDENLDRPCGRGIMLMRAFLSLVEYNDTGNCVILEKHKNDNNEPHIDLP